MHDIDQVIAFVVHFVNFGATFGELTLECKFDDSLDYFWVRLVADFEDILFGDLLVKA